MPQISTQLKMLRAVREILMGSGRNALPQGNDPKPAFLFEDTGTPLPRSTPEAEGLSSALLHAYYRRMAGICGANLHSLLVLRHGRVISEGYFTPFKKDIWHVTHSLCKTLVGTAVGIAIDEGLFGLEDSIVQHFPKEAGLFPSKNMRAITVRHVLAMSSGITFNEMSEAVDADWLKGIFSSPVAFVPGTKFVYNSMNSYLLSALICRKSGQSLVEYLTPRLLAPMGFGPLAWEKSYEGYEKGGWGLYMMPEDMAKLGQLYLQQGVWHTAETTKLLVSSQWILEAMGHQIKSDGALGYGYQCWVDDENASAIMNGMFGQYVIMVPRLDMVITMTAGNTRVFADSPSYFATKDFLASLGRPPDSLPPAPLALARLGQALAALSFRQPIDMAEPPAQMLGPRSRARRWRTANRQLPGKISRQIADFCGTTWQFKENQAGLLPLILQAMNNNFSAGLLALHVEAQADHLTLLWEEGDGTLSLPVGFGRYQERSIVLGREGFQVACRARVSPSEDGQPVLVIEVCFLESSSLRIIKLTRSGPDILLKMDEQPQLQSAIEGAIRQSQNNQTPGKGASPFGEIIAGNDYMDYRLFQLCTPQLIGVPAVFPSL